MLISEVRELLKKYKEDELRLIISEMYKSMPKKMRENKDIDALLQDVNAYLRIGKVEIIKDSQTDIKNLKLEIEQFVDYAYKQYYFVPNSFVHKKERPKWRFKVKAYIKSLQVISVESEEGSVATDLLEKLYNMLCYGCGYYIFSTDNPFRSVGIEQVVLLDTVIVRKLGNGINKESIKSAIELVINSNVDRETLHSSLINVFVKNLKSSDAKKIAIDLCMDLKEKLDKSKSNSSKKSLFLDSSDFQRKEKINNLVEMVFKLNIALCEYDEAIKYFNCNNVDRDSEVTLYVLLRLLLEYELKEYWLREYDEALKKGVKPREALKKTYKYICESDKLPEYFLY
ncbi:hypothetical protein [Clostridium sp.]|uniref:hypothetical protein n=1 Tax=Clostridium sp. TaxID=1506 RepID=UPI002602DF30|nr:hypothetical protein [Clostridium sp.]